MRLSCHGAARDVTGSCHLLELDDGTAILVDCGMFQGSRELAEDNADPFGFEPSELECVLLTHAHLDHCGRLPLLIKRGFTGRILATPATRDLARIVMLDAAEMQEEDARRSHGQREAIFDVVDALDAIEHFSRRPIAYDTWFTVYEAPDVLVRARYQDAGHILGSASILLEVTEHGRTRRIMFSGDLGGPDRPIVREATPCPDADLVVMEATYGDRDHRPFPDSVVELWDAVADTLDDGGKVFIPSFALERSQGLLIALRMGILEGRLPHGLRAFLDSPMAISATTIYRRHPECYDEETRALFEQSGDPFGFDGLEMVRESGRSRQLSQLDGGAVIIAGSGMCTGGRIVRHIENHLADPSSTFVFVSYAGSGTLARKIIDGEPSVRVGGRRGPLVAVRARVHTINGFSAHAGKHDLLEWRAASNATRTVLVHGEMDAMTALADELPGTVDMPERHAPLEL